MIIVGNDVAPRRILTGIVGTTATVVGKMMFANQGPVNDLIAGLGFGRVDWFGDPDLVVQGAASAVDERGFVRQANQVSIGAADPNALPPQ